MSNLAQTLKAGRLAVTAECLPPRSADAATVRKLAAGFPARLDAVVVAEAGLACAAILAGEQRHPVLSLLTRDRNRLALEADALGAAALSIDSLLCLSGDHQSIGEYPCPQAAGAFDVDSIQLLAGLHEMGEKGVDFAGRKLDAAPALFLGAAAHPYLRPMALNLLRLRKKVRAGAAFLMTQAVFDLAGCTQWMDAVRAAGIDQQAAIIASVLPLTSAEQARRLATKPANGPISPAVIERMAKAADPVKEGIAIAAEIARQLKAIAGVRGIHIFSGFSADPGACAAAVIEEAGLAQA